MHQSVVGVLGRKWNHRPCWVTAVLHTRCADVFQEHGVKDDELQSILNYLLTMHEVGMHTQTPHRCKHVWPPDGATTQLYFLTLSDELMCGQRALPVDWSRVFCLGFFSPLIWRDFRNVCLKLQNITMYSNDAVLRPLTFFVMSGFAPKIVICVKFTLISLLCYFCQKSKCPLNSFHLHLFFLSGWQPIGCPAVVGGSDVWTSRFYGSGLWPAQRHPVTATLSLKRVVNSADLIRVQAQEINLIFCLLWWDN